MSLSPLYVAGALLDGTTMMNQYRHNPGLMEQLNTYTINCKLQLSTNPMGEFNLVGEGREGAP